MSEAVQGRWQGRAIVLGGGLLAGNLLAWGWAMATFGGRPDLLALCAVIYGLGLRHALDADHIAAIDNVTRTLMHHGHRPVAVGVSFALGHSLVVILVTALAAWAASSFSGIRQLQEAGRLVSGVASTAFLVLAALANLQVLRAELRRRGPARRAWGLTRWLAPAFGLVRRSWQMAPLGVVFGLSFDTATEVALFGLSAAEAARGASVLSVMVFPVLFAAAMASLDGVNGLLVMRACAWSLDSPERARRYNLVVTTLSIGAAATVAALQLAGLAGAGLHIPVLRDASESFSTHASAVGLTLAVLFALCLGVSWAGSRARRRAG